MDQAGVPIEFNNVCSMMRWFQKKPNVNIKTQIIGFSAEKLEKIYPIDCKYYYSIRKRRQYSSTASTKRVLCIFKIVDYRLQIVDC